MTSDGTQIDPVPALEQKSEHTAADVATGRNTLDRLNKRFYQKLQAEARSSPALAAALAQIDTESDNLPGTLSIQSVVQGGANQLHILVSYVNGTGADADEQLVDWMVGGVDADFTHTTAVNQHGTRTSATLVIQQPA